MVSKRNKNNFFVNLLEFKDNNKNEIKSKFKFNRNKP